MAEEERYQITPTLQAYLDLEQRVVELEAQQPAGGDEPAAAGGLDARLNRHRDELEELKRRYIGLLDLLRPYFPDAIPPADAPAAVSTLESPL